jgi:hypothetical protein
MKLECCFRDRDSYKHLESAILQKLSARIGRPVDSTSASFQEWSRNQHELMLESRKLPEEAGRHHTPDELVG